MRNRMQETSRNPVSSLFHLDINPDRNISRTVILRITTALIFYPSLFESEISRDQICSESRVHKLFSVSLNIHQYHAHNNDLTLAHDVQYVQPVV